MPFALYKVYVPTRKECKKNYEYVGKRGSNMSIFDQINAFFANMVPIGDMLWIFPMNFEWYTKIPILGQIPFAVLLLLGIGIYFTFRTKGVQFRFFKRGLNVLICTKQSEVGVTPLASFMLSTAMRVGPGNIVGVTGAISIGGPGALFWMWTSALFGMASSFTEATLAQIFKERNGTEYVGGLPYYGQKLLGNRRYIGIGLGTLFIAYALLSVPIQTFHVFTAIGAMLDTITGTVSERQSMAYYVVAVLLIVSIALAVFGGIKRVTSVTDKMVPIMAVIYGVIIILILFINIAKFPGFIAAVVGGAFQPQSIFGGTFGIAIAQGIKRGLLSNEAGQGTITMAAAVADTKHPCEQGFIQAIGVFLDTIIICTLSGFVVGSASIWNNPTIDWETMKSAKLDVYLQSLKELIPGTALDAAVTVIVCLCYALFAFTTLLGLISFSEIAGSRISTDRKFINGIRTTGALIFVPFGTLCVLAGLQLDNLWYISDFINIVLVFANVPIILVGAKYVYRALKNYMESDGKRFVSAEIGLETEVWKLEESEKELKKA